MHEIYARNGLWICIKTHNFLALLHVDIFGYSECFPRYTFQEKTQESSEHFLEKKKTTNIGRDFIRKRHLWLESFFQRSFSFSGFPQYSFPLFSISRKKRPIWNSSAVFAAAENKFAVMFEGFPFFVWREGKRRKGKELEFRTVRCLFPPSFFRVFPSPLSILQKKRTREKNRKEMNYIFFLLFSLTIKKSLRRFHLEKLTTSSLDSFCSFPYSRFAPFFIFFPPFFMGNGACLMTSRQMWFQGRDGVKGISPSWERGSYANFFFLGFLGISDKRFYLKQKLFSPFSFLPSMHAGVLQNVRLTQVIF